MFMLKVNHALDIKTLINVALTYHSPHNTALKEFSAGGTFFG
jgi:hypothetical protein